jgi:hypothetical protein
MAQNAQLRREQMQLMQTLRETGADTATDRSFIRQTTQQIPKLKAEAITQGQNVSRINKALQLIETGVTGKGGQLKAWMAPYAEAVGVPTPNMNDAQLFQMLTRVIIGPMRLDIVGPGPVSEWEQQLMQKISGGGGATKDAARELLSYYKKQASAKVTNYNDTLGGLVDIYPKAGSIYKPIAIEDTNPTGISNNYPTATNPKTGEKSIFKDGKWQPM